MKVYDHSNGMWNPFHLQPAWDCIITCQNLFIAKEKNNLSYFSGRTHGSTFFCCCCFFMLGPNTGSNLPAQRLEILPRSLQFWRLGLGFWIKTFIYLQWYHGVWCLSQNHFWINFYFWQSFQIRERIVLCTRATYTHGPIQSIS